MSTRGPGSMGLGADFFRIKPEGMRGVGEKALKGIGNLIGTKEGIQEVDGVPVMGIRDTAQAVLANVAEIVGGKAEFLDEGSFTEDAINIAGDLANGILTLTQDAVNALLELTPERIAEIGFVTAAEVFVGAMDPFVQHDKSVTGVKSLPEILASLPELLPMAAGAVVGGMLSEAEYRITQGRPLQEAVDDWIIANSEKNPECDGSLTSDAVDCMLHPVNAALYAFARDEAMKRKYPDPRRIVDSKPVTPTARKFNPLAILDRVIAHSGLGDSDINTLFL